MKASWLFVLALGCVVVQAQVDVLLQAFPNGDHSVLADLPIEAFEDPVTPFAACPSIPVPPDTNDVNKLKPGHIKIIMGMGDSITAAMSAKDSSIISLKEYRGLAYSMGADAGITTFPNILKPYLTAGYPIGTSTGIGARTSAGNGLNAAVSGAINSDLLSQAQWLVTQLKANAKININTDWKVLTIWMGSNNLCAVCNNAANNNGANFETNIVSALNYLYANVPRLFVNLVANLDISSLYNVNSGACSLLHSVACACVGSSDAAKRSQVSVAAKDYVVRANNIAKTYNARNSTSFAVVVQPFLVNNVITDRSLLSAADCFHPSATGHVLASVALWNNMLTVASQKKKTWSPTDVPICPTADSIFPLN